jgi:ATP-dependent Clp protease ATP-binding subunit ClpA
MFERYTERARRVIFFSRYEASQFGSTTIETEHLLLGLLREDKNLIHHFVPALDLTADFTATSRRIGVALRNQYILGYQSTNPAHDGTYRHLEVKLNVQNVPDLRVHTRDGYYAFGPDGGQR